MTVLRYVICDVFSDEPFKGNQLAVFTNASGIPEETLQALAREMNFSESVFVFPPQQGGHIRVRIFTPTMEVPFAGHPILGAAFVIGRSLPMDEIRLETNAGIIPISLERDGTHIHFGWMVQPNPTIASYDRPQTLFTALGVDGSVLPVEVYDNGIQHLFLALETQEAVLKVTPDYHALLALPVTGINVFAGAGLDYKTRMFAPKGGITEDPATGSAAGPLAVHLVRHGRIQSGEKICISQGEVVGRPSTLYARAVVEGSRVERVEVGGSVVIVARGEFHRF